jgi:uncharacterized linocin/CFP29 family protein
MLDQVTSKTLIHYLKGNQMSNDILQALEKVETKFHDYNTDLAELRDRMTQIEQRPGASFDVPLTKSASLGDLFIKQFDTNRDLFEKTRSVRLEIKAAADPVTTASGRKIITGGVGVPGISEIGIQYALPTRQVGSTSAVEYSRYTGLDGAAAVQAAEGDTKAAVRPAHSLITQNAITIAGWTKLSRQALNDQAEIKKAIDVVLADSVNRQLSATLTAGSAAPVFTGYSPLATAYTSTAWSFLPDAISEGIADMQLAGFNPDVLVIHPKTWMDLNTEKGTDGHYLTGNFFAEFPNKFRGLRVVLGSVAQTKAMVMDSRHSELLVCEGFGVEVAYSGDDFVKNLVTILGEMRVIPVFRTVGSIRLITPKV